MTPQSADLPSPVPPVRNHPARIALYALCVVFAAGAAALLNETMIYSPDSAHYLAWARSLASLDGWRVALGPEPFRYVFNAPLYPLLLAPVALLFPYNVVAAKIVTALAGVVALALFYRFTSSRTGWVIAIAGTLFLALHPLLLVLSTQVLSDVPFAAVLIAFLLVADRFAAGTAGPRETWALIALAVAALFLREVGVVLVFAAAVSLALLRRYRSLLLLLMITAIAYGLWYLRNEAIYGSAEDPDLRNLRMVFSHVTTASSSSLGAEFAARIWSGVQYYGPAIGTLVFAPTDQAWPYDLVRPTSPLVVAMNGILPLVRLPALILTVVLCGTGVFRLRREPGIAPLFAASGAAYTLVLLLYPVTDVRYLLPVLIILLWLAARGMEAIIASISPRYRRTAIAVAALVIAAAALPNVFWDGGAIATNLAYFRSPETFAAAVEREDASSNELTLISRPAAEWIAQNSTPSTAVMSLYKESGLWLSGRPVVTPGPFIATDDFDGMVRDYGVGFLITGLRAHQVHDFEAQMAISAKYRFVPVYRAADTEVFRIEEKASLRDPSVVLSSPVLAPLRRLFLQGILSLRAGKYAGAIDAFSKLRNVEGVQAVAAYYAAASLEFSDRIDEAESLYREFRTIPQATAFLEQARYHEDIIALTRESMKASTREELASLYHSISLSYWILGFRAQARVMMDRALQADPQLYIGHVFGGLYALADGDTVLAGNFIDAARRARPADPLTRSLTAVMTAIDSLHVSSRPALIELAIGREYVAAGLYDLAIDQSVKALRREPDNSEALESLAALYTRKRRPGPAIVALRRLLELRPEDSSLREQIRLLTR